MPDATYETEQALSEYLLFHYGPPEVQLPWPGGPADALNYPVRCAELVIEHATGFGAALDLGCAVGRSSFELARRFNRVTGVDYSHNFIRAAQAIRDEGGVDYRARDEGLRAIALRAQRPEGDSGAVEFMQGDACALPGSLGAFDAVLMANLIDRLHRPAALLERLPELIRPGGIAVITSPYTWLEEYTGRAEWIGGTETESASEALSRMLDPDFQRIDRRDLPFLIREHARKFQWSVAEATVWKRN